MSSETPSLIPMPGKVYLRRLDPVTNSSPYLIPDQSKEKGTEAEVLAIPSQPNYEYGILIPCPLSVGQKVLIGKYAGEHDWAGKKITIVRIDEILAVIKEADEPIATADELRAEELTSRFLNKLAREGEQAKD